MPDDNYELFMILSAIRNKMVSTGHAVNMCHLVTWDDEYIPEGLLYSSIHVLTNTYNY